MKTDNNKQGAYINNHMIEHYVLLWLMAMGLTTALQSCQGYRQVSTEVLEVMEQDATISASYNGDHNLKVTVDVPQVGPDRLVDSVLEFINRQLYETCEEYACHEDGKAIFTPEEIFTDDADHLLCRYMEKYQPQIPNNRWKVLDVSLKMEAQTTSYVTYGMRIVHCAPSMECGSEKFFFSFAKRDGHLVREIISHENLVHFYEDYPEYKTVGNEPWTDSPEWENPPNIISGKSIFGLLEDHFTHVTMGPAENPILLNYPYGQIYSYLPHEVQGLVVQKKENELMLPSYLPTYSEDGNAWMETDSATLALVGHIRVPGGDIADTLARHEPGLEIYPKRVHSIETSEGPTVYLFIYSRGHLLFCDEALACKVADGYYGLSPEKLFSIDGQKDSIVSSIWYDQLVEVSSGFPFSEMDENRFGIHYDSFSKRLYIPIMESHEKGTEFENCLRYTGRFEVLSFNGKEFVPNGTDGAWWLHPDLREYKRTISNLITTHGIEQTDLMPDGTSRHVSWRGAKTLDDLRKRPDKVYVR